MAFTRPAVCVVTDRHRLAPDARTRAEELAALVQWLDLAAAADVDLIHVREPDLDAASLTLLVRRVVDQVRQAGTPTHVVVNSRADVAIASGAHGVHLRADDPATSRVRALLEEGVIGRSLHAGEGAAAAVGADFLCFGPVFPSRSKPGARPAGLAALSAAVAAAAAPVLAIGGITPSRAGECRRAGAAGVAGIDVFLPEGRAPGSLGVDRAVQQLRRAMMSVA